MAQDLVMKLNDAEWQGELESLTEIAESLFTHVCNAKGEAAAEKEKNMVLMREIQRLEERNGILCTELDRAEERHRRVKEEVEQLSNSLKHLLDEIRNCKEDNARLSTENYQLETQIRQMVAKMAKEGKEENGDPSGGCAATSLCAREALGAVECPKCGSMDAKGTPVVNEVVCAVCGTRYEVDADG